MMLWLTITLICLFLIIRGTTTYDFFVFSLPWPPGYCLNERKRCASHLNDFIIQGLWPHDEISCYPTPLKTCPKIQYDEYLMSASDVSILNASWPDLFNLQKPVSLWGREWHKHGRCSSAVLDQKKYFDEAVLLYNHLDLSYTLTIVPSNTQTYELTVLENTIRSTFGVDPIFVCEIPNVIREVRLCVDKAAKVFIDCPCTPMGKSPSCIKDVYLLPPW